MTPDERAGAKQFLDFLGSDESVADGVREHFRPTQESASLTLAPPIKARAGQGFQSLYTTSDLPDYGAINDVNFQLHKHIADGK